MLGGAALAGRVVRDGEVLRAPLVYSTEVARSIQLATLEQLRRYDEPQRWTRASAAAAETVSGDVSVSRWRVVTDADDTAASSMQPVQHARVMERLVYGLVNVRTDGHRLLFAIRNEGNATWSTEVIEPEHIARAERWGPVDGAP